MRRRRAGAALATATAVVVVAGCSALPRSGPVATAEPQPPAAQSADFFAGSPVRGASPAQIVQGFLDAQAGGYADDNFAVAREYLAPNVAATWDPSAGVRIYADESVPASSTGQDGAVVITADLAATLSAEGRYVEAAPGSTVSLDFTVARNAQGQWRIASLEDGVLLSPYVFSTVYSSQPLYFLTADRTALVPDLRWIPRDQVATQVVEALLEGPSESTSAVGATELPEGLRLGTPTVEITDGIAAVTLSGELSALPEPQRSLAALQISRSLFGVANVREVAITSQGETVEIDPAVAALSSYPLGTAAQSAVAVSAEGLVRLGEKENALIATGADLGVTELREPTQGIATPDVYALDGASRLISVDPQTRTGTTLATGEGLVPPSADRHGWVWTADDRGVHAVSDSSRQTRTPTAEGLAGRTVAHLAVSREGSRIAVVSTQGSETFIEVYGVVRDGEGAPRALVAPDRVGTALIDAADVAWVEDVMIAVLGRSDPTASQSVVHLVQVGGVTRNLPLVDQAETVTALRGARSLVVGTSTGELWVRNGAGWREGPQEDVRGPSYPG